MRLSLWPRQRLETTCTIEVEHTNESLSAHVTLAGDLAIAPGDKVRVHGAAIRVPFGERLSITRPATVERANRLEQAWTKFWARFELTELYEVSFTPGRLP